MRPPPPFFARGEIRMEHNGGNSRTVGVDLQFVDFNFRQTAAAPGGGECETDKRVITKCEGIPHAQNNCFSTRTI